MSKLINCLDEFSNKVSQSLKTILCPIMDPYLIRMNLYGPHTSWREAITLTVVGLAFLMFVLAVYPIVSFHTYLYDCQEERRGPRPPNQFNFGSYPVGCELVNWRMEGF